MKINPLNLIDFYKVDHRRQYGPGVTKIVLNLTPRKSRIEGIDHMVFFGLQYFIKEYLIKLFNENFFGRDRETVVAEYKARIEGALGKGCTDFDHIGALHDLGYLPLHIMALPEGSRVPMKVAPLVMWNTHPDFFWLPNYLESIISASVWQSCTSATLAYEFKRKFLIDAERTTGIKNHPFVAFQGHDFSFRGMSSLESACMSGAGHLLSFSGTDTVPALDFIDEYYHGGGKFIGGSIPATEHSVMCMGTKEGEIDTFRRLLALYPTGAFSVVSDSWDFWKVLTEYLPELKSLIMARDGKLVIRPDSGDPVRIICGDEFQEVPMKEGRTVEIAKEIMADWLEEDIRDATPHGEQGEYEPSKIYKFDGKYYKITLQIDWNRYDKQFYFIDGRKITKFEEVELAPDQKGAIEILWDIFGGEVSETGYKILDSHIGLIYGDGISLQRQKEINKRLEAKGFASINWVAGIGSFTYQYVTRDTFGTALKATYGEIERQVATIGEFDTEVRTMMVTEAREIFKDPKTDDGMKKSAKGLIAVYEMPGTFVQVDQVTWEEMLDCEFETVFLDGKLVKDQTFEEIRNTLSSY